MADRVVTEAEGVVAADNQQTAAQILYKGSQVRGLGVGRCRHVDQHDGVVVQELRRRRHSGKCGDDHVGRLEGPGKLGAVADCAFEPVQRPPAPAPRR